MLSFELCSSINKSGNNSVGSKVDTVQFGFGLFIFDRFNLGWVNMDRVWNGLGYFGCGSFWFMLNLRFSSIIGRVTSGVRVKGGWSHFVCQFEYGFRLFNSVFGFQICLTRSSDVEFLITFFLFSPKGQMSRTSRACSHVLMYIFSKYICHMNYVNIFLLKWPLTLCFRQ